MERPIYINLTPNAPLLTISRGMVQFKQLAAAWSNLQLAAVPGPNKEQILVIGTSKILSKVSNCLTPHAPILNQPLPRNSRTTSFTLFHIPRPKATAFD